MEVIGTVGAIAGIIDVAARSISTLADVRKRYKQANMTVELLSGQLVAIETALNQIRRLIEESLQDDQHYQLVMNMDVAINGCNLLVRVLDEHMSKLEYNEDEKLTFESRTKVVLESKGMEECLTRLDRQMSALNLIITAYSARNPGQQKELMEDKQSQKIFDRVKDDSSSLYVLCDSASFVTKRTITTTATSKLSMNFAFDDELLRHRAYKSTFRSLLRRAAVRQSQNTTSRPPKTTREDVEYSKRNAAIDRKLEEDARRLQREAKVLVLGSDSAKVVQQMKIIRSSGYTEEERSLYRITIHKHLLSELRFAMDSVAAVDGDTKESPEFQRNKQVLDSKQSDASILDGFDPDTSKALRWCAEYSINHYTFDISKSHYMNKVERILEPGYVPSADDIVHLPRPGSGIYESRFKMGQLSVHIFQANLLNSGDRKKWIHQFENVTAIMLTVDLSCYDHVLLEDSGQNRMMEALVEFDSIVNSGWFTHTSIILILCNVAEFRVKLDKFPLENYFPDYSGGNDVNRAAKYLLWRFNQVNRAQLDLYPHLVDLGDTTNFRLFFAAVKETILQRSFK